MLFVRVGELLGVVGLGEVVEAVVVVMVVFSNFLVVLLFSPLFIPMIVRSSSPELPCTRSTDTKPKNEKKMIF